ncbi:MAG: DUF5666 domain-containing protein [Pseudomonadota bacterium]
MADLDRRGFLAAGAALALSGCVSGTEFAGGGRRPRPPRTGGIGGTGIVGTLTELGSIVVNGLRIELDDRTAISDAFGPLAADSLTPGLSLTVEAEREVEDGPLIARRVQVTRPVIGTVTGSGNDLRVAGVPVRLLPGVAQPAPGSRVAVSGLWNGTTVVASRLDPAGSGPDILAGDVGLASGGIPLVGGRPILGPAARFVPMPVAFATLIGRATPEGFAADQISLGRFAGSITALEALSVEGYLEPAPTAPGFAISGLGHSFDPAARLSGFEGRSLFVGPYTGTFDVALGLPLPEEARARRALLSPGFDPLAAGARPAR